MSASTTLAADTMVLARRNLEHIRQIPEKLLDVTLQPVMFTLLFAYVFGGAIGVAGGNYHEYLVGGILVQTLAFGVMGPGVSIATDLAEGVVDRLRTLPMNRAAYLLGHAAAEWVGTILALIVLSISGLVVGWRIHAGILDALAGYALLAAFGLAMVWLGTLIGLSVRSADAVQGIAFGVIFPITFVSTAFVPIDGMPAVLKTFAEWNPVSTMVTATRTLFGNPVSLPADAPWPLQHPVLTGALWTAGILAVAVPLCLRKFRARTAD
ncbi:MAG: ABC transporter permease [Solirubrobacteraceae bacterium]|nr:ABC transporter permease [Solirubrobacteraceae bacterium]